MPITTETYRNIKQLNALFALSGLAFLAIVVWMMAEDHNAPWKYHQADFQRNSATLAHAELERYSSPEFLAQLDAARQRVESLDAALADDLPYQTLVTQRARAEARLQGAMLDFNDAKSVLDVVRQDYERARTLNGDVARAESALHAQLAQVARLQDEKEKIEDELIRLKADLKERTRARDDASKNLASLERRRDAAHTRLALNERSATNWIRNNLLDFAVKTIEVKQVVLPHVRSDLNFLDTFQVDRCQTCHIAIDRKEFTDEEMIVALSLSVAAANGTREKQGKPPIALPFELPAAPRNDASGNPLPHDQFLASLATLDDRRERFIRDLWDVLVRSGDTAKQKSIRDAVLAAFNEYRTSNGIDTPLELAHPLKAHPRLDLYVSPDSPHPMNKMGCTVCHGGNGQETSFTTAIHTAESHEQEHDWIQKYEGRIDYSLAHHWWNRPMLARKNIEAGCVKCHAQVADVAQYESEPLATTITAGRQLFTQVGCINCHKEAGLEGSRKVGPDLSRVASKLKPEFIQPWVFYPKDFRPSTWMPHFFAQENNIKPISDNDPDPDPTLRTETEVAAITHYLTTFSTTYVPEAAPHGAAGNIENGRKLFDKVGCLACHAALAHKPAPDAPSLGESWITRDLVQRNGLSPEKALHQVRGMSLNDQVRYALKHFDPDEHTRLQKLYDHFQWEVRKARKEGRADDAARLEAQLGNIHVPPAFTRFAPELSGIGSKVSAEWLYDWLRNPTHYHNETKMPSLRLAPQEALDIAAYLVTFKNDEFRQHVFELNDRRKAMADRLILQLLEGQNSKATAQRILNDEGGRLSSILVRLLKSAIPDEAAAKARIDSLDLDSRKLAFLGNKMINHYGCYACHTIPGFEKATPPGTELTTWAEKSINQLDFAFFEHMFEHDRGDSFEHVYPQDPDYHHLLRDTSNAKTHITHSHGSFAWHKMRNPRIWDRGKVKSAYDKLKMPNFFFTDRQADALTTFLLSRRRPFVSDDVVPQHASHLPAIAAGRNLAAELNCVGCHNIENNSATMHQFILAALPGGSGPDEEEEDEEAEEAVAGEKTAAAPKAPSIADQAAAIMAAHGPYDEVNGPPWLRGEGAKVQHAWLYDFLHNVQTLRPWLAVRMPSFHLTNEQATTLVNYFAALSKRESDRLRRELAPLDRYIDSQRLAYARPADGAAPAGDLAPGDDWFREPQFRRSARFLSQYALLNRLANPLDFAVDPASKDAALAYAAAKDRAAFFRDLYDVHYPFVGASRPSVTDSRFELGREMTIDALNCLACHALGDPNVPGANKAPSAPNLSLTYKRLRPEWVYAWFQEPAWIQPGTKMPQWFPSAKSAFRDFPDKDVVEAKFGLTGPDQMHLMLDFLYEAGARFYTGVRGGPAPKPPDQQSSIPPAGAPIADKISRAVSFNPDAASPVYAAPETSD